MSAEDDLRRLVLDFRASVSGDLEGIHRDFDALAEVVRQRITLAETTVVNELRHLGNRVDRRLERIENRLNELGT